MAHGAIDMRYVYAAAVSAESHATPAMSAMSAMFGVAASLVPPRKCTHADATYHTPATDLLSAPDSPLPWVYIYVSYIYMYYAVAMCICGGVWTLYKRGVTERYRAQKRFFVEHIFSASKSENK